MPDNWGEPMSSPNEPRRESDADACCLASQAAPDECPSTNTVLRTDERVLARVTDGIYRQPGIGDKGTCVQRLRRRCEGRW